MNGQLRVDHVRRQRAWDRGIDMAGGPVDAFGVVVSLLSHTVRRTQQDGARDIRCDVRLEKTTIRGGKLYPAARIARACALADDLR